MRQKCHARYRNTHTHGRVRSAEDPVVSHDEGSSKPGEADLVTDDGAPSLRDTQPGVPVDMELSRTLPTGAAFHMTWRSPQPQIVLPNTPASPLSPDLPGSAREVNLRPD